jgi:hypothetical protein
MPSRSKTGSRNPTTWALGAPCVVAVAWLLVACASAQQRPDLEFQPTVNPPVWQEGAGPRVAIDAAHQNFHTANGRYAPLARLLRRDGFRVESLEQPWTEAVLAPYEILIVANPLHPDNARKWRLPTPSAFTEQELEVITRWVEEGGSLWLIADHMPFPGAAAELGRSFGLFFLNAYAVAEEGSLPAFERKSGLGDHPITRGRSASERIDTISTFGGQAFRLHGVPAGQATPLLTLPERSVLLLPIRAGRFRSETPTVAGDGLLQGVALRCGAGRVAAFGEAAMFSAQLSERRGRETFRMGMNAEAAPQNAQFALNVAHWLSGLLD